MLNVNISITLADGEEPSTLEQNVLSALSGNGTTQYATEVYNLTSAADTEFDRMVKLAQEFDQQDEPVNGTPDADPSGPHMHEQDVPDDQDIAEQEADEDEPETKPEPPKKAPAKRRATATRRKAAPKAAVAPQEDEEAPEADEPTTDDSDAAEAQQEPEDETPAVLESDEDADNALEDAMSKATQMVRSGKRDTVKAALKAVDVARVSELTPDKVSAFLDELGE